MQSLCSVGRLRSDRVLGDIGTRNTSIIMVAHSEIEGETWVFYSKRVI